jgi:hypothetical protein
MSEPNTPRFFENWRTEPIGRAEDAANTFGYDLMLHCRAEALKATGAASLPATDTEFHAHVAAAVDVALHNVMDLLEGFWRTQAGPNHTVEYALAVCVKADGQAPVERIDISPCLLDLPIGYWKWKEDFLGEPNRS